MAELQVELEKLPASEQVNLGVKVSHMQTERYIRWALGGVGFMFACIGLWFLSLIGFV